MSSTCMIPPKFIELEKLCISIYSHAFSYKNVIETRARLPPTVGCNTTSVKFTDHIQS